jgi:Tol biopolymer transport system component/DNA-binding winged helix-turn-helix (wHTH) protein
MHRVAPEPIFRFEAFEFDVHTHELRKHGVRIRLAHKPFQALHLLLENAGTVVRREQLRDQLWEEDAYGDFEDSLNHVIKRLRDALLDAADSPKFIETIPGSGYRFVAPVELVQAPREQSAPLLSSLRPARNWLIAGACVALVIVFTAVIFRAGQSNEPVAPRYKLTQLTRDAGLTFQPTLCGDGEVLAFASDRAPEGNLDIWLNRVAGRDEPRRLTNHEADDYQPSFAPDGTTIAFRSDRGDGGVYVVPALGGPERLVAKGGRNPKFSPDGKQIAFWVGGGGQFYPRRLYVVDAAGGPPRQLAEDFDYARHPIWSPDGRHLVFVGIPRYRNRTFRGDHPDLRWWIVPVAGGPPKETGILAALKEHRLDWRFFVEGRRMADPRWNAEGPQLWLPETNNIVFSAQSGDSVNLWRIPISAESGTPAGAPVQLTAGAGSEVTPMIDGQGRTIFSTFGVNADIWSLPIDPEQGLPLGNLERLTHDTSINYSPSISADGNKVVFLSDRPGNSDLWIKDMESGKESPLTATEQDESRGLISADGSKVAYALDGKIYIVPAEGGASKEVLSDCGKPCNVFTLSPNGETVLYYWDRPVRYALLDLRTGEKTEVLQTPESASEIPYGVRLSPDTKWLSFFAPLSPDQFSILVAPLEQGANKGVPGWTEVSEGSGLYFTPSWSPQGRLLYFVSRENGLAILARPLDATTKRPTGPVREVYRFPQSRYSLPFNTGQMGLWFGGNRVVFTLQEITGSIWMAEPQS